MSEQHEQDEATEPEVADVPEPDQDPHEPVPDEAEEDAESIPFEPPPDETEHEERVRESQEAAAKSNERTRKAELAFKAYQKKIETLWEDDVTHLAIFPLGAAAPPGFIDVREAGRVPDEIKESVLAYLGMQREQDYEADPYADECSVCKGKGKTRLPTKVAGKESRTCHTCKGFGFIDKTPGGVGAVSSPAAQATNGHVEDAPLAREDVDNWGQPKILPDGRENPNWGRTPDYWVQVPPWGDTRNLNVGGQV